MEEIVKEWVRHTKVCQQCARFDAMQAEMPCEVGWLIVRKLMEKVWDGPEPELV